MSFRDTKCALPSFRTGVFKVLIHPTISLRVDAAQIRSCPGQALADASIWLAIANIVALFDILEPVDKAGKEYMPPAKFTSAFSR